MKYLSLLLVAVAMAGCSTTTPDGKPLDYGPITEALQEFSRTMAAQPRVKTTTCNRSSPNQVDCSTY